MYFGVLLLLCFNLKYYVCRNARYKSFYVLSFYVFSLVILVVRLAEYTFLLFFIHGAGDRAYLVADDLRVFAVYADVCLGMF